MSSSRQPVARVVVRTSAVGFSSGYRWAERRVPWGQLIWASRGAITVHTGGVSWLVLAGSAMWLPPAAVNDVLFIGRGVLRTVYLSPGRSRRLARAPRLVRIAPLLRELVRRAMEHETLDAALPREARVAALLTDELESALSAPAPPVDLPMPRDARAAHAAACILDQPGRPLAMLELPREAGASRRTLERRFRDETGLSLGAWHQRATLRHGLARLAEGDSVKQAAAAAGYANASAFIAAFRRLVGMTPGAFVRRTTSG